MSSYPVLAQEIGDKAIYIVDIVNVNKWHIPTYTLYQSIVALGYSTVSVPVGTLAQFPTIANPILSTIAASGDEDAAFSELVQNAVTAALRTNGLIK